MDLVIGALNKLVYKLSQTQKRKIMINKIIGKLFNSKKKKAMMEEIVKSGKYTVVDVRTKGEYSGGHVNGSINIPLDQVSTNLNQFKNMEGAIVLCCASGNRSGQATNYLKQQGFEDVHNGGSWFTVKTNIDNASN